MNTISVVKLMPTTNSKVFDFYNQTKAMILSGQENPLEIAILLKGMEDTIKKLRTDKEIEDFILDEVEREGKSLTYHGATLAVRETGVKYDYSACGDAELNELSEKLLVLQEKIKVRQNVLKAHKEQWADTESGEMLNPPVKTGKTKVSVTLGH